MLTAIPIHSMAKPVPSGNLFMQIWPDQLWLLHYLVTATKAICNERKTVRSCPKRKSGALWCNWRPVCGPFIRPVLHAGWHFTPKYQYALNNLITTIFSLQNARSHQNHCHRKTCPIQFCRHYRYRRTFRNVRQYNATISARGFNFVGQTYIGRSLSIIAFSARGRHSDEH